MRFQVQWEKEGKYLKSPYGNGKVKLGNSVNYDGSKGYTYAKAEANPDRGGVTVAEAIQALDDVLGAVLPRAAQEAAQQASPEAKSWLREWPDKGGVTRADVNNQEPRAKFEQKRLPDGRIDITVQGGRNLTR